MYSRRVQDFVALFEILLEWEKVDPIERYEVVKSITEFVDREAKREQIDMLIRQSINAATQIGGNT